MTQVEAFTFKGKTINFIHRDHDRIVLGVVDEPNYYYIEHHQECCEDVNLRRVDGDPTLLIGDPIVFAEDDYSTPDWAKKFCKDNHIYCGDSFTWTRVTFATAKHRVDFWWLGTSNGYYGETVSIYRVE